MAKKKVEAAEPSAIAALLAQTPIGYNPMDVKLGKNYSRYGEFTEQQIYDMANSLKVDGQLQPIIVNAAGFVLSGNLRTLGARYLVENDPDCAEFKIYGVTMPEEWGMSARRVNLIENMEREDLSAIDLMQAFQGIVEDAEQEAGVSLNEKQAAEAVLAELGKENNGDNRKWVTRHLRLTKVPDAVREAIHSRQMALDAGLVFAEAIEQGMGADVVEEAAAEVTAEAEETGTKATRTRAAAAVAKAAGGDPKPGMTKPQFVQMLTYLQQHSKSEGTRALSKILVGAITGSIDLAEPDILRAIVALTVPEVKGTYAKYAKVEQQVSEPGKPAADKGKGKGKKAA